MNSEMSANINEVIISYLVPSYNHEKYIMHLLESIALDIEQLNVASEILILDDGSTDNSVLMIKRWTEKNLDKFNIKNVFQENEGICSTLNKLVHQSSGKYIRICASDDLIIKGSTQILLNELINNQALICVIGDGKIINDKGEITHHSSIEHHGGSKKRLLDKKQLPKEIIQNWCIAGPCLLVKKEHYNKMKYDENLIQEDLDFFLTVLSTPNSVSFIEKYVCLYRIHGTNTSKTGNKEKRIINHKSYLKTVEKHMNNFALSSYLLPVKFKCKAKIYYLEKKYIHCAINMMINLFLRLKSNVFS